MAEHDARTGPQERDEVDPVIVTVALGTIAASIALTVLAGVLLVVWQAQLGGRKPVVFRPIGPTPATLFAETPPPVLPPPALETWRWADPQHQVVAVPLDVAIELTLREQP